MKLLILFGFGLLTTFPTWADSDLPVKSPYTEKLKTLANHLSVDVFKKQEKPGELAVICFSTPDHKFYIGAQQLMRVKAPLDRVAAVVNDYPSYAQIFDGIVKSSVEEKPGTGTVVFMEQNVPIPFISNVKTFFRYEIEKPSSVRQIFFYQLLKSNSLTQDDGFIWLEEVDGVDGKKETLYAEFDFFDADWGIATTFAPGRIWSDSIKALYQSDIAFQLKAEHPDWTNKKVLEDSKKLTDAFSTDKLIESKKPLSATYPDVR